MKGTVVLGNDWQEKKLWQAGDSNSFELSSVNYVNISIPLTRE